MKKYFLKFADNVLSHSQQKAISGGISCNPGYVACWCPGAGQGCCKDNCSSYNCGGRDGCSKS